MPSTKTPAAPHPAETPVAETPDASTFSARREALGVARAVLGRHLGLTGAKVWRVEDGRPTEEEATAYEAALTAFENNGVPAELLPALRPLPRPAPAPLRGPCSPSGRPASPSCWTRLPAPRPSRRRVPSWSRRVRSWPVRPRARATRLPTPRRVMPPASPRRPVKVVGYLRVSTQEQATDGYGLGAQREAVTRHAAAYGWEVT